MNRPNPTRIISDDRGDGLLSVMIGVAILVVFVTIAIGVVPGWGATAATADKIARDAGLVCSRAENMDECAALSEAIRDREADALDMDETQFELEYTTDCFTADCTSAASGDLVRGGEVTVTVRYGYGVQVEMPFSDGSIGPFQKSKSHTYVIDTYRSYDTPREST